MLSFVVTKEGEFRTPRLPTAEFEALKDGETFFLSVDKISSDYKLRMHCREMGRTLGCVFKCWRYEKEKAYGITRYSDQRDRESYPLATLQPGEAFHVNMSLEAGEQAFRVWVATQGRKQGKKFGVRKHVEHELYEVYRKG
jgi:hypothetical protein